MTEKEYDDITYAYEERFIGSRDERDYLLDATGKELKDITNYNIEDHEYCEQDCYEFYRIYFYESGISPVSDGNKIGLMDINGNIIVPLEYDTVNFVGESKAIMSKDGKYGLLQATDGAELVPFEYDYLSNEYTCRNWNCSEEYANSTLIASKDGKYGLISEVNEEMIPFEYEDLEYVYSFDYEDKETYRLHGFAFIEDEKYGLIDTNNKVILPAEYDLLEYGEAGHLIPFSPINDFIIARKNDKVGAISKTGEIVIPFKYGGTYPYNHLGTEELTFFKGKYYDGSGEDTYTRTGELIYSNENGSTTLYEDFYIVDNYDKETKTIYNTDGSVLVPEGVYDWNCFSEDDTLILEITLGNVHTIYKDGEVLKAHYVE